MEDNEFEDILLISWTDVRSETQDYTLAQFEAVKGKYRVDVGAVTPTKFSGLQGSIPSVPLVGGNNPVLKYLAEEDFSPTAKIAAPPIKFLSRCIPSMRPFQKFLFAKNRSVYLITRGEAILNGVANKSIWELKKLDDVSIPNEIQFVAQTRRSIWVFCDHYPPRCYRDLKFHATALFSYSGFNSKGVVTLGNKIFYRNNYGEVSVIDECEEMIKTTVFVAPDARTGPVLDFAVDGVNRGAVFWIGTKSMQIYRKSLHQGQSQVLKCPEWDKDLEKSWPSHAILEVFPQPPNRGPKPSSSTSSMTATTTQQTTLLCVRTRLTEPGLDVSLLSLKPPIARTPQANPNPASQPVPLPRPPPSPAKPEPQTPNTLTQLSHLSLPAQTHSICYKARISAPRRGTTVLFLPFGRRLFVVGHFGRLLWLLGAVDTGFVVYGCAFVERGRGCVLVSSEAGVVAVRVSLE